MNADQKQNNFLQVFSDLQDIEHELFTNNQKRLEISLKLIMCKEEEKEQLDVEMEKLVEEAKKLEYKRLKQQQLWDKVRKEN